jgi:hypothetical protein
VPVEIRAAACRALAAAEAAAAPKAALAVQAGRKILRAAAHPAAAHRTKASSKDPAAAVAQPADRPVVAVQQAARLAVVECKAAAQPAVPEPTPVVCKVAAAHRAVARLAEPERTPVVCKAAARRAVAQPAALRVAVECKAVVLRAAAVPQVGLAPWVAADIPRPEAEPVLLAAARKAHKGAAVLEATVAAAVQ